MTSENGKIQTKIMDLFKKFTPLHKDNIAAALEINESSLNSELHNLKKLGKIGKSKTTDGYWYDMEGIADSDSN